MAKPPTPLPVADLTPRPITMKEYFDLTPEKMELWSGYLIEGPDHPESRRALLSLVMANLGLLEVVKLAPRGRWIEALARAFPPEEG